MLLYCLRGSCFFGMLLTEASTTFYQQPPKKAPPPWEFERKLDSVFVSNGIYEGFVIDFMMPVYPQFLGGVSSSQLSESVSKLLIITIYWGWLDILAEEMILVSTGARTWAMGFISKRFSFPYSSLEATAPHRLIRCSSLKGSHSQHRK